MRTLKKSLCLVLALVMVLGLCMIGANATYANYTDKEEITYADAVEVLTGLNVVEGYPDDEFKPTNNVTRAEAAAMITRMMLGREKADKLPVGDVKFNDVPETNWAAKYIAFCANRGIIVGVGNGNFEPSRDVTGTEMACMLLRALGYGAIGEYEGKGWDINAVADALYYKVFENTLVADFSQPATREETALYVWNTMRVELVGYDVDLNYYDGKHKTFAGDVFGLEWYHAQLLENQATGNKYSVVDWWVNEDDEYGPVTRNLDIETELDLIAHEVIVYYKADVVYKDKQNTRYYKAFVVQDVSSYLDPGSYFGDMYNALVAENKNNKTYPLDTVQTWINYVYEAEEDTIADMTHCANANAMKGRYTFLDMLAYYIDGEIILNSNGNPLAYRTLDYTVDQVKKISGNEITLKYNDYFDFETYDLELAYDGIAKGDYVTVQPVGDLCYLYPTTTEEVNVFDRSVSADTRKLPTFNKTISAGNGYDAVTVPDTDDITTIFGGDKVLFYMDYYGYYFAAQVLERGTLKGVVFVNAAFMKTGSEDKYGKADKSVYVQCVDEEGKEVIYQLNSDYTEANMASKAAPGVYRVYTDSKDLATLSPVGIEATKDADKTSFVQKGSDIYYVNSDTKVLYVNKTLKDMKVTVSGALTKEACTVYANVNGKNLKTVWIVGKDAPASIGTYVYVYGMYDGWAQNGGSQMVNDATTYYFTLYKDGAYTPNAFVDMSNLVWKEGSEFSPMWGIKNPTYYLQSGFYTYTQDEFGVYKLEGVAPTTTLKSVTAILYGKNFNDEGELILDKDLFGGDATADGVKLDVSIVNCAYPTTADGKKYLTLNTLDDVIDFLKDNDKNWVMVSYLATKVNSDWVPNGAMYITYGSESAD